MSPLQGGCATCSELNFIPNVKTYQIKYFLSKADVLVHSTTQGLDVHPGLQEAAGPGLRTETSRRFPNGISYGDVAVTGGHGLPCKYVFHIALQSYLLVDALQVCGFVRHVYKCYQKNNRFQE